MYILACGDVHTHERMYTCIYSIHTFVMLDVDMICQDVDMICIYVCMYVYSYMYVYIYICIYIYI